MSDLTPETLAELRRRADAAFIAAASPAVVEGLLDRLAHMCEARNDARAEVERLTVVVDAVRALHQPVGRHNFCGTCAYAPWPCPTYRALDDGEADR